MRMLKPDMVYEFLAGEDALRDKFAETPDREQLILGLVFQLDHEAENLLFAARRCADLSRPAGVPPKPSSPCVFGQKTDANRLSAVARIPKAAADRLPRRRVPMEPPAKVDREDGVAEDTVRSKSGYGSESRPVEGYARYARTSSHSRHSDGGDSIGFSRKTTVAGSLAHAIGSRNNSSQYERPCTPRFGRAAEVAKARVERSRSPPRSWQAEVKEPVARRRDLRGSSANESGFHKSKHFACGGKNRRPAR